ncbi:MAG TPA: hypothetical protein VLV28_00885, partial [Gaiellaceae bacterium]|nr:hypothetical protein [Gaiellaceae bacterium]
VATGSASSAGMGTASPLALMPLPGPLLGPLARSLTLDPDSGTVSNAEAAKNATRPTSAARLSSLGRRTGYRLDYHDPTGAALVEGHGLLRVSTEVDRYRDEGATSAGLVFVRDDALSVASLASSLLEVRISPFAPGKLGEQSFGLMGTVVPKGERPGYEVDVGFRTGPYLASVSVSAAAPVGLRSLAQALASKLEKRVAGVLRGRVSGSPVTLPSKLKAGPPPHGPDLSRLALSPGDLGSGKVSHEGYQVDADLEPISEYDRHMEPAGPFPILDSEVALFHSPIEASYTTGFAIGGFGSTTEVRWVFGQSIAGVKITTVTSKPVAVTGRGVDEARALVVTIRLADGERLDILFAAVRKGSTVDLLTAFSPLGQAIAPAALRNLVSIAARRLNGGSRGNIA